MQKKCFEAYFLVEGVCFWAYSFKHVSTRTRQGHPKTARLVLPESGSLFGGRLRSSQPSPQRAARQSAASGRDCIPTCRTFQACAQIPERSQMITDYNFMEAELRFRRHRREVAVDIHGAAFRQSVRETLSRARSIIEALGFEEEREAVAHLAGATKELAWLEGYLLPISEARRSPYPAAGSFRPSACQAAAPGLPAYQCPWRCAQRTEHGPSEVQEADQTRGRSSSDSATSRPTA